MFRQDRTNPSTAVSTWKARKDLPKANPSTAVSDWMNGGLGSAPFVASGGDSVVTYGSYKAHIFTGSGNFIIESGVAPQLECFVIAGGGSGSYYAGGGGGAGGFLVTNVAAGTGAGTYAVTIGAGGAGQTSTTGTGNAGSDTTIAFPATLTAVGGGATYSGSPTGTNCDGGSGAGQTANSSAPYTPGSGTAGQGNDGGAGEYTGGAWGSVAGYGGGGGKGGVGGDGTGSYAIPAPGNAKGGAGGAAFGSTFLDGSTTVYYAGGGGGSGSRYYYGYTATATPHPLGGTNALDGLYWNASNVAVPGGAAAPANRGGGGASRGNPFDKAAPYGSGGSGIVCIRYLV